MIGTLEYYELMNTLLTVTQVAAMLCIRKKRVYELTSLPCVRLSDRSLRWRYGDVVAWIESRRGSR